MRWQRRRTIIVQTIEDYLASVDLSSVMPGAEPFFFDAGDIGCLLLHGWAGTCDSMRYLGQRLQGAGITVFAPLLPGHGTCPEDMAKVTAEDWVRAAVRHLYLLADRCPSTFVAGLSMGGTLTLYLGATQGDRLRGIAPINGAVFLNNPDFAALAFRDDAPDMVPIFEEGLLKDPTVTEVTYDLRPRNTVLAVLGLAKVTEELLLRITVPTLILQSKEDGVVPASNAELFYERISSSDKRIRWLNNSYHVATLDYDKDIVADEITGFIRNHT
jgi:carboxylesterase